MLKRFITYTVIILLFTSLIPAFAGDFYLKVDPANPPTDPSAGANLAIADDEIEAQRTPFEAVAVETALSQFEDAEIDLQPVMSSDQNFQNKLNARRQLELDRQQLIADMQAKRPVKLADDRAHIRADIALLQQLQLGIAAPSVKTKPVNVTAQQKQRQPVHRIRKPMNKFLIKLRYLVVLPLSLISLAAAGAPATHGMVVSEQALASQIGVDVLRAGGNAIDAAVAVGYALAVVNPCCGNIGGAGFMLIHLKDGKTLFINFRSRAPLRATADMFLDHEGRFIPGKSLSGYAAVAVPGTVLGLDTALTKYGTRSRQQVMQPAIQLAEQGFRLTAGDVKLLQNNTDHFKQSPSAAAIFLKEGKPYQVGDLLVQKDLAVTLKQIAQQGPAAFYRGDIAAAIVKASEEQGGILSRRDFADYTVEMLTPVQCTYHSYTVYSAAPPSSGGTALCEILNILEPYPLRSWGFHSARSTQVITEAERFAFFDRNNKMGDPDFVKNPVAELTSKSYAAKIRERIRMGQALSSRELTAPHEGTQTTHYSVVDAFGNAVSVTYSLNSFFGADVVAGRTGFLLNNDMDDFTVEAGTPNQFGLTMGVNNAIAPGKRPLSSMSPTLLMKGDQVVMVVGSPGGPRIITSTLQTILNVVDYGMSVQAAVDAPRFHHQWLPDVISMEAGAFTPAVQRQLTQMGYHLSPEKPWSAVEAIYIDPRSKKIDGGSDKRRLAGKAVGY